MDKVIQCYNQGKFQQCLELLNEITEDNSLEKKLVKENCRNVCQALLAAIENDATKINEIQEILYVYYKNVTSLKDPEIVSLELKLVAEFNLMWWILQYGTNDGLDEFEIQQCLETINDGILRVLDNPLKSRTFENTAEEILQNIMDLDQVLPSMSFDKASLILENVVIALFYISKKGNDILPLICKTVAKILPHFQTTIVSLKAVEDFCMDTEKPILFKFGFIKVNEIVSDCDESNLEYLSLIQFVMFYLKKDYKSNIQLIRKSTKRKFTCLWYYLAAVNSFQLGDLNQSLGFLMKNISSIMSNQLKSRCYLLQGRLYSSNSDRKEALMCYGKAKDLDPSIPLTYYYIGVEYGKMGLNEMMVESFEEMIKILRQDSFQSDMSHCSYESTVLRWIHPSDEVTMPEALYVLAVAYGLSERFRESTEIYNQLISERSVEMYEAPSDNKEDRHLPKPNILTVLHEAATVNLLSGNMIRAEVLCNDASDIYLPKEKSQTVAKDIHPAKDLAWLSDLIKNELGMNDVVVETGKTEYFFEEDIWTLEEDAIGLFISSEVQRMQESDTCITKVSKLLTMLSKYLAKTQKTCDLSDKEKRTCTLIKALTAKVCLRVAKMQAEVKSFIEVDRMFKRALTCNQGDKDVLYNYALFLKNSGNTADARRLWETFNQKDSIASPDDCQSLALKHLLNTEVSKRQLEQLQNDLEFSAH